MRRREMRIREMRRGEQERIKLVDGRKDKMNGGQERGRSDQEQL